MNIFTKFYLLQCSKAELTAYIKTCTKSHKITKRDNIHRQTATVIISDKRYDGL